MPPTTEPSPLPDLSPDDRELLVAYLVAREDLFAFIRGSGLEPFEVLAFTARPDITPWLEHFRRLETHRLRAAALASLERLLREAPDPIEERRTAGLILRATAPNAPRAAAPRPDQPEREPHPAAPPSPRAETSKGQCSAPGTPASLASTHDASPDIHDPHTTSPLDTEPPPSGKGPDIYAESDPAEGPDHDPDDHPGGNPNEVLDEDDDADLDEIVPQLLSTFLPPNVLNPIDLSEPAESNLPAPVARSSARGTTILRLARSSEPGPSPPSAVTLLEASGRPTRAPP